MTVELNLKLTLSGKDAIWNSKKTGIKFDLTHIQFGSRNRVTTGEETSLVQPKQYSTLENGSRIAPEQIRIMSTMTGLENYNVTEIGLWSGVPNAINSVLFAYASVPSGFIAQMVKGIDLVFAYDMVLSDAETVNIIKDSDQSSTFALLAAHETDQKAHPFYFDIRIDNTTSGNNTFNGTSTFKGALIGNLTGNADTATKLKNVRKINNVPFDGTQDILIQKVSIRINKGDDLDYYVNEGSFYIDSDADATTIKNSPTNLSFALTVDRTAGYVQRLTTYQAAGTKQFIRSKYMSGWTPWYRTYSELDPQPTVDAIDNLTSNDTKKPLSANQGRLLNEKKFDKSGGDLTGEISINTGESSPIKTVINKSGSITTNSPTDLASIIHALSFGWYESEWQIGNVRSGSQASAGFGVTLGNSNLRFLINGNGTSNYGTFDSVGNITAPMFLGKLSGRIKTETSSLGTDKDLLDKLTTGDSSSFFFDNGGGNKYFTQFSVGVSANLQDGGYFLLGASPLDNKVKAMSGVREASGGYRLQKNLTLLDSESNNVVSGDFVWDKHKLGGWARGLVYKAQVDSVMYSGMGAYGNTDTVESIYFAVGGDNIWSKGNGKGIWIDGNGAYTNCNWTFTGWASGSFTGLFDGHLTARDNRNISPSQLGGARLGYYFSEYTGIRYGNVTGATYGDFLAFNGYNDTSGGKANGLFLDKINHRIYHFQNAVGAKDWGTPREIAYTDNQNFTGHNYFEHGIRATNFGLGFKYLAKGIAGDSDAGWIGVGADQANAGFLEIGTADDGTEPIFARQYSSGSPSDEGARSTVKNELVLLDANGDTRTSKNLYASQFYSIKDEAILCSISGRYLFINSTKWGGFSPASGYIPLSVDCGGTGNGQGIAPSATRLNNPRKINGVNFDGTGDITTPIVSTQIRGGDLNNVTQVGFYFCELDVEATAIANTPTNYAFSLLVERHAGITQKFYDYTNKTTFTRSFYIGVWSAWVQIAIITDTAPSANKLATPRRINGVNFDGTSDITIEDSTRFRANGVEGITNREYPAWNAKSGVYRKQDDGASSAVLHFLGDGSCPAVQFDVRYASGGLWYRSARDNMGFEKAFDRIVTESGGIAPYANQLYNARLINGVGFNGTGDINISAPLRELSASHPDVAVEDGFYCFGNVSIAGLYPYGVLETRKNNGGSVIHQTFYSHNANENGSVAVRQSWGGAGAFQPWRVVDKPSLGYGQSYQNLTGSRVFGTTYTNTSNMPIQIFVTVRIWSYGRVGQFISDVETATGYCDVGNGGSIYTIFSPIILPQQTYAIKQLSGGSNIISWWEVK